MSELQWRDALDDEWDMLMAWPKPEYSRSQVDKAGVALAAEGASQENVEWATAILGNWRACHGHPVNTFQATLRTKLKQIDPNAIVAQRLKRAPTIIDKLQRNRTMKLSKMQDIGGLRAVVGTVEEVGKLHDSYITGRLNHELRKVNDYIRQPKSDGYRSLHLIYGYNNTKAPDYKGLTGSSLENAPFGGVCPLTVYEQTHWNSC